MNDASRRRSVSKTVRRYSVYGYGSDGEPTLSVVIDGIMRTVAHDGLLGAWGLTSQIVDERSNLLDVVTTKASRLPIEVARGKRGEAANCEAMFKIEPRYFWYSLLTKQAKRRYVCMHRSRWPMK
ncbi:DUF1152 domain-containing protein [Halocatena marina]|uniref:DUF1152 domain-containing protein n=1 Tax=Halocatena marina TaxID=2934937 RepID=A0ABD5YS62_9EURY|nr:DUF1152 domain-containing protein [Halocatena marina]